MRILTISDIHIHNYRFHKEYEEVFEELYKKIEELKPDFIINTGDTAHTKLNISPAWVNVTTKLFRKLASYCPNIIILGNHDLNVKNTEKLDAISPIVSAIQHPNIYFSPKSEVISFPKFNVNFHILSLIDQSNWNFNCNPDSINIGLYHGSIKGAVTDGGWLLQHGEIELEQLKPFDYVICGDIHHSQQLDKDGRIRYVGNLVQFNFGETNDKGFLVWDIESKNDFKVTKHILNNPKPFVTVNLTNDGKLPNTIVPPNSRLKLVAQTQISQDKLKKVIELARHKYKPESLISVTNFSTKSTSFDSDSIGQKLDLHNHTTQEELIKEYLTDYKLDQVVLEKIYTLNRELQSQIEEESIRNSTWKIKYLEWDNFFKYGENNFIDFSNMNGILGLFANNSSGKTSTIDILLLTIFNSTSKNEKKNINCINYKKKYAQSKIILETDEYEYTIERKFEKYNKGSKKEEQIEAKVDVNFERTHKISGITENLNGDTRNETDRNIRKIFGTLDDFLLTSVSSQLDSLKFINEGWTKRKEILGRFLDLEQFEFKFKKAKDLAQDYKTNLKKFEKKDFASEINQLTDTIQELQNKNKSVLLIRKEKQQQLEQLTLENAKIEATLSLNNNQIIDIEDIEEKIAYTNALICDLERNIETNKRHFFESVENINQLNLFLENNSIETEKNKLKEVQQIIRELSVLNNTQKMLQQRVGQEDKKTKLLNEVPCGEQFPHCKFIQDAFSAKNELNSLKQDLNHKQQLIETTKKHIDEFEIDKLEERIKKFELIKIKKQELEIKSVKFQSDWNLGLKDLEIQNKNLLQLISTKTEYETNSILFKETFEKQNQFNNNVQLIDKLKKEIEQCDKQTREFYKNIGYAEQKQEFLKEQKNEYERSLAEYSTLELFLRCMHPNGIPFVIIKKNLPKINEEINKLLSMVSEFQIFLDADEKQLNVLIQQETEPLPIEVAGGAEKTLATIAIRLALLTITTLPKCDIMILDEPGTALDSENLSGFISVLELLKTHFKSVILISHLDSLKDCADRPLSLGHNGKFAILQEK